ncbi:1-deoxy-D-xylulose-5-phosphate synthase [Collinsella sp. zg1085]|uniref:1-deoxy-D-xylulose-5-phosphate synthase n=1 Tax=Collinsella sp. zg1085 TaxID=2844380 RepID=UPI001C0BFE74|nr:1-deoxy-D-xylulose-5-phosphate synthase [Collinsella sp. zg1085]QWT17838.1 1-deoxy-D-xylulose-5-phosphate synthase [Collinsella sp. zg1085]
MLLEQIAKPSDIQAFSMQQLLDLCTEIRQAILFRSSLDGGHVGSNLGVVELTVALHRVFHAPQDCILFDVSHQTYAHKMLTGRAAAFLDAERFCEASGFANPFESEYDAFVMGHTSTSISLACGFALARAQRGSSENIVVVIGDGSLSGGMAFEGLDHLAELGVGVLVIVNDNNWSIAENHGGIYRNLAELRRTQGTASHNIFEVLGFEYHYLEAGNNLELLMSSLACYRDLDHPVVLHVHTLKGCGFARAEADPEAWHHPGVFELLKGECGFEQADGVCNLALGTGQTPQTPQTYADISADILLKRMKQDPLLVSVSAATPYLLGFSPEKRSQAGTQFVDVGIAEQHAVSFVTALAAAGARPVLGIYSVFLQRAYDQLWHDMCLNNAPVTLVVCGCSVYGSHDATHLGFFDIPLLAGLPNLTYLAPVCCEEYEAMLAWAIAYTGGPVAIRMPGQGIISRPDLAPASNMSFADPRYQVVRKGSRVAILGLGSFFELGESVAGALAKHNLYATVVNPRFALGVDAQTLHELAASHELIITLEDGVLEGGWGEQLARELGTSGVGVKCYGFKKSYPDRFDTEAFLYEQGLTVKQISEDVLHYFGM